MTTNRARGSTVGAPSINPTPKTRSVRARTSALAALSFAALLSLSAAAVGADVPPRDMPDAHLTPGIVTTTDPATICRSGYARTVRPRGARWARLKNEAYQRYGLGRGQRSAIDSRGRRHAAFSIDHLVPLELGGSPDDIRNLWPQPRDAARRKDDVENTLHELVCSGRVRLTDAQHAIERDWKTAPTDVLGRK